MDHRELDSFPTLKDFSDGLSSDISDLGFLISYMSTFINSNSVNQCFPIIKIHSKFDND